MAEDRTLARPYAEAVFELAQADTDLGGWSNALEALATITANPDMAALMDNPEVADSDVRDVLIGVAGDELNQGAENLVRLLIENNRLRLVGAIAEAFEARRAELENRIEVNVLTAAEISDTQRQALGQSLEKRLARDVSLSFEQDDAIIGGAVIRAGDLVIDASVRTQLDRMRLTVAG